MKKKNNEKINDEKINNEVNTEEVTNEEGGCSPDGCASCGGCSSGIDPETMVQILGSRNQELEDKYIRLQAEYLNFKTRTQTEVSRMLQYEGEDFIKEMLVIKDNLERAVMMDDND